MSQLGFMEKLLDGVEVEWKVLEEVSDIYDSLHQTPQYSENGLNMIRVTDIKGSFVNLDEALKVNNEVFETFTKKYLPQKLDLVMSRVGSYGNVGIIPSDNVVCMGQNTVVINPRINNKYLFYILVSNIAQNFIEKNVGGGNQKTLSLKSIKKIPIPIPCPDQTKKSLAIQAEIVHILDTFTELVTELTSELTSELSARKKQYNYYRDQLFNFEVGEVDHSPMGKEGTGEFIRGGGLQKKDFTETGVGCIHYGQLYTYYGTYTDKTKTYVSKEFFKKARKAKTGDLVIATTSENDEDVCKSVAWLGKEEIAVSSDACIYRHRLNAKYVSYFFQTEQFQKQKRQYITGIKVRRVNADNLAKVLIPVPSPEEQARIVDILDKFEILTSSLIESLAREVELRQKKYEYYRDLLLSFPNQCSKEVA